MQNMLFGIPQSYAWVLEHARHLLALEDKENASKIEHQINTRIYNNALCGMLRAKYPFERTEENGMEFIQITIDSNVFRCPVKTVENILRNEYADFFESAASLPQKNEKEDAEKSETPELSETTEYKERIPEKKNTEKPEPASKTDHPIMQRTPTNITSKELPAQTSETSEPSTPSQDSKTHEDVAKPAPVKAVTPPTQHEPKSVVQSKPPIVKPETPKPIINQKEKPKNNGQKDSTTIPPVKIVQPAPAVKKNPFLMQAGMPDLDDFVFSAPIKPHKILDIGEAETDTLEIAETKLEPKQEKPEEKQMDTPADQMLQDPAHKNEFALESTVENITEKLPKLPDTISDNDKDKPATEAVDRTLENQDTSELIQDSELVKESKNEEIRTVEKEQEKQKPEEAPVSDAIKVKDEETITDAAETDDTKSTPEPKQDTDSVTVTATKESDIKTEQPDDGTKKSNHFVVRGAVSEPIAAPLNKPETQSTAEVEPKPESEFPVKAGKFRPKTQPAPLTPMPSVAKQEPQETPVSKPVEKEKGGFFSALFGSKKKSDTHVAERDSSLDKTSEQEMNEKEQKSTDTTISDSNLTAQEPETPAVSETPLPAVETEKKVEQTPSAEPVPVVETKNYSQDGGKLFKHIHEVNLEKRYAGGIAAGPYRFIFWPIRIVEKFPGRTWADFLVHITEPNGNEIVMCTDGKYKELEMKIDGKEFKVYGMWNNGVFESHISLLNKTDSMFVIKERVQKEEPEEAIHDSFLNQFRFERKGQPKHFIVPFKNNNRGELNIPIIGYVELNNKKYPLERREGNTLRYRYAGNEKIIRGHWEDGIFVFTVDDANRIIWEDGVDE